MITRNQVSDILEKSISLTVDKLYKRDIELIELAASRRMFHKDFQYYSGDRPPIASHMIKKFRENGFKARVLLWRTLIDMFNEVTCGTIHVRVSWK